MRRAGIIEEPSDSRGKDCCNPVKWVTGSIPGVQAPPLSLLVNAQMCAYAPARAARLTAEESQ